MSDLVERLESASEVLFCDQGDEEFSKLCEEAADRIEQLEATLQEAITRMTEAAREAGHWKGKYEAAGYPGTLDGWIEKAKALEAENARLQNCVWRADYLAIAAQKLVDVERTHAGCSGIQFAKLSEELALYWKHAGGTPSARAALAGKAGE